MDIGANIRNFQKKTSFIVFLRQNDLWDDIKVHEWIEGREK